MRLVVLYVCDSTIPEKEGDVVSQSLHMNCKSILTITCQACSLTYLGSTFRFYMHGTGNNSIFHIVIRVGNSLTWRCAFPSIRTASVLQPGALARMLTRL